MAQHEFPNITIHDYLTLDHISLDARYEYLEGELRMLAGGSPDHSLITTNVTSLLHALLRGERCLVYNTDMKLQLSESRYVYPDITISCDPRDEEPEDNRTHYPSVVVEVLSPGTEMIDRGKKLLYYQAHPTIHEYIMLDSQRILVEVYHREKTHWTHTTYHLEDTVPVENLALHFSVIDAYAKTSLLRKATREP